MKIKAGRPTRMGALASPSAAIGIAECQLLGLLKVDNDCLEGADDFVLFDPGLWEA